ncbi:MAG: formylglycine-generating enzyme family protein [Lewinellaceae bacterium]|nr:formylglycine-generating enzyme family protein [Saprospiraceae bacterium]MCB9329938.1 formylglycine-generating enzyme family protein [Lewinellaceae bacterium]
MPTPAFWLALIIYHGIFSTNTTFSFDYPVVEVKGGTFQMGQPDPNIGGSKNTADECPHQVTIQSFAIGKYEVTHAQWLAVMGNNPRHYPVNCDSCPVTGVSWQEIQVFIKKLNQLTGEQYRLPSEAEWEFAARGGSFSRGFLYAGSNTIDEVAWTKWTARWEPHPVGSLKPNELGLCDMSGNAWEWCQDQYGPYPGCTMPDKKEAEHVCRGGSFRSQREECRVTARIRNDRDIGLAVLGFRLAMDKQTD